MKIYALGIDLGKTMFHLVGLDTSAQVDPDTELLRIYYVHHFRTFRYFVKFAQITQALTHAI